MNPPLPPVSPVTSGGTPGILGIALTPGVLLSDTLFLFEDGVAVSGTGFTTLPAALTLVAHDRALFGAHYVNYLLLREKGCLLLQEEEDTPPCGWSLLALSPKAEQIVAAAGKGGHLGAEPRHFDAPHPVACETARIAALAYGQISWKEAPLMHRLYYFGTSKNAGDDGSAGHTQRARGKRAFEGAGWPKTIEGTIEKVVHSSEVDSLADWQKALAYLRGTRTSDDQPASGDIQGECPDCGGAVVSLQLWMKGPGGGYFAVHACWNTMLPEPTCSHGRVL